MSKLLIFTAPSGAGKTTIVHHLLHKYDELAFSVSATTRSRRPGEVHGIDYYFLSREQFRQKIAEQAFAEWEEVYENQFYGTLVEEISRLWNAGKHIIFDIEVKGALNIKRAYPNDSLAIFVKPPSQEILFERLRKRQTENEKSLQLRIERAALELTYENKFDRILVNNTLEDTLLEAEQLVEAFIYG